MRNGTLTVDCEVTQDTTSEISQLQIKFVEGVRVREFLSILGADISIQNCVGELTRVINIPSGLDLLLREQAKSHQSCLEPRSQTNWMRN